MVRFFEQCLLARPLGCRQFFVELFEDSIGQPCEILAGLDRGDQDELFVARRRMDEKGRDLKDLIALRRLLHIVRQGPETLLIPGRSLGKDIQIDIIFGQNPQRDLLSDFEALVARVNRQFLPVLHAKYRVFQRNGGNLVGESLSRDVPPARGRLGRQG